MAITVEFLAELGSPTVDVGTIAGGALRLALVRAGLADDAASRVVRNGRLDLGALVAESIGEVEIRSRFSPPVTVQVAGPPGPPSAWMQTLKPAVEVRSPFGTYVYAPEGDPGPTAWKAPLGWGLAAVAALGGLGALALVRLGRRLEKRR